MDHDGVAAGGMFNAECFGWLHAMSKFFLSTAANIVGIRVVRNTYLR